jgi:hypothetical protein
MTSEIADELRARMAGRVITASDREYDAVNFWHDENDYPVREEWIAQTVAALDQGVPVAYVGFLRVPSIERVTPKQAQRSYDLFKQIMEKPL